MPRHHSVSSALALSPLALALLACSGSSSDDLFGAGTAGGQAGSSGSGASGSAGTSATSKGGGAGKAGTGGQAGSAQGGKAGAPMGMGGAAAQGGSATTGKGGSAQGGSAQGGSAQGGSAQGGSAQGGSAQGGKGGGAAGIGQGGSAQAGSAGGPGAGGVGGGTGASGGTGGSAGVAGAAGAGGQGPPCTPGEVASCYDGPAGTEGSPPCTGGTKTCDPNGTWGPCAGQVVPVADACDGVDTSCDGTWTASVPAVCPTIQKALDAAAQTGTTGEITVSPGTYKEALDYVGAKVKLTGAGVGKTIVDAGGKGASLWFHAGETSNVVVSQITFQGGSGAPGKDATTREGGCIAVVDASPTLQDLELTGCQVTSTTYGYGGGLSLRGSGSSVVRVRVFGNQSDYYGGGISLSQSPQATLTAVDIRENKAVWGGGIASYFSSFSADHLVLAGNTASGGGGMFAQGDTPQLTFVTFHANASTSNNPGEGGGALYVTSVGAPTLRNVAFTSNKAIGGAGIFLDPSSPGSKAVVTYSDFSGNVGGDVAGMPTPVGANGCVAVAPGYVSVAGGAATWDLHPGPGSALIDAGDPAIKDADGTTSDIGAYSGK